MRNPWSPETVTRQHLPYTECGGSFEAVRSGMRQKLVPGGPYDPPLFPFLRKELLKASGLRSCAVPAASKQRLRQSIRLAPHQPSDHEEKLFATALIDPGEPRVQTNPCSFFAIPREARERLLKFESLCKSNPYGPPQQLQWDVLSWPIAFRGVALWRRKLRLQIFGLPDNRMLASPAATQI